MEILYFKEKRGNFGDDLNLWIWDELLPGWRDWTDADYLVGVGTILKDGFLPEGKKLVVGSGVGYGAVPDISDCMSWDIRAVRGPKSAKALGLDHALSACDPAMLLPRLEKYRDIPRGNKVLFVPHIGSDLMYDWRLICADLEIEYLSPSGDADIVIRALASAKAVVAESMHAAIISDAFATPWRAVAVNKGFNYFKWEDWLASLSFQEVQIYQFFPILRWIQEKFEKSGSGRRSLPQKPASGDGLPQKKGRILSSLAKHHLGTTRIGPFYLSDREKIQACQDKLLRVLEMIKTDYG